MGAIRRRSEGTQKVLGDPGSQFRMWGVRRFAVSSWQAGIGERRAMDEPLNLLSRRRLRGDIRCYSRRRAAPLTYTDA